MSATIITHEYPLPNSHDAVLWRPHLCRHAGHCVRELGAVFNLKARPWINASGADAARLVAQVHRCPSGALRMKLEEAAAAGEAAEAV